MKHIIDVQSVSFSYDSFFVLSDINLTVSKGEFLGIVGPNAGGKSTLLKLILGLLQPQSGKIFVRGYAPQFVSHQLGYVPQFPGFSRDFPITVEQVVLMGRLGLKHKQGFLGVLRNIFISRIDRQMTAQALQEVEVDHLAKRQIGSLSGGQLQRVLIARALVGEPCILVLDEPTANIDQRMESEIFDLLKILNQRMTILVVSHDVAFISHYVNRVACVNQSLVCHSTNSIDGRVMQTLYGKHVRCIVHH